jgi:hypothetical protein
LISLLPYTGNSEWVEPRLLELKACLMHDEAPSASAGCEFCGYIAATHKVENGRVARPPPPRRPISNRHPADQIADVREQIAVLKKQETDQRETLINATELDRVGEDWIAKVSEQKGACLIVRRWKIISVPTRCSPSCARARQQYSSSWIDTRGHGRFQVWSEYS